MDNNGLIYLASPYTHPDIYIMEKRYLEAVKAVNYLMNQGKIVFSPIVHNHPVAVTYGLPRGWDYWKKYDGVILKACNELMVYQMNGWQYSKGIEGELKIANELKIPISYLSPIEVSGYTKKAS
jgi:hypothetical protein